MQFKNILKSIVFLLVVFVLVSCNKDRPMVGKYLITFRYTSPLPDTKELEVEITGVARNQVSINGFELRKSGRQIDGEFESNESPVSRYKIDGNWSKTAFQEQYSIIGRFTEKYTLGGNEYQASGTFEMTNIQ